MNVQAETDTGDSEGARRPTQLRNFYLEKPELFTPWVSFFAFALTGSVALPLGAPSLVTDDNRTTWIGIAAAAAVVFSIALWNRLYEQRRYKITYRQQVADIESAKYAEDAERNEQRILELSAKLKQHESSARQSLIDRANDVLELVSRQQRRLLDASEKKWRELSDLASNTARNAYRAPLAAGLLYLVQWLSSVAIHAARAPYRHATARDLLQGTAALEESLRSLENSTVGEVPISPELGEFSKAAERLRLTVKSAPSEDQLTHFADWHILLAGVSVGFLVLAISGVIFKHASAQARVREHLADEMARIEQMGGALQLAEKKSKRLMDEVAEAITWKLMQINDRAPHHVDPASEDTDRNDDSSNWFERAIRRVVEKAIADRATKDEK